MSSLSHPLAGICHKIRESWEGMGDDEICKEKMEGSILANVKLLSYKRNKTPQNMPLSSRQHDTKLLLTGFLFDSTACFMFIVTPLLCQIRYRYDIDNIWKGLERCL